MVSVVVNVKKKSQADRNDKGGVMQQDDSGNDGDLNVYHRDFPKISSNFYKRNPLL